MKGRIITLLIALLLLAVVMILGSCGANYHLRMAKKHLKRAEIKGAKISTDTTWTILPIISPEIKFETTFKRVVVKDTLISRDKKTGSVTKLKLTLNQNCPDSCIREINVSTYVPPQKSEQKTPIVIKQNISAGHGFWYDVKLCCISAVIGFILSAFFWVAIRSWIKSFL
jgi:hypothetical protein